MFWLGQTGDPRAFAALHGVIENAREDERIRAHAIFSLSHGGDTPDAEFTYLRNIYPRLTGDKLKEAILMGMRFGVADRACTRQPGAAQDAEECAVLGRAA